MKKYLFKFKGLFFITFCLTILCAILDVYFAFVLSDIVDVSISKDMQLFKNSILIALGYLLVNASSNLINKVLKSLYLKKTLVTLKGDLFSKVLRRDISSFSNENTAKYISTLTNDETIIEEDYFNSIFQMTYYLVSFIAAMYSLIKVNYSLIIAIFIGGALTLIVPQLIGRKLGELRNLYSENMAKYTSKLKDMFSGFEVIKSFNVVNKVVEDFNLINEDTEKSKYKFHVLSSIVDILSGLFGSILHVSVMMVGVYLTIKDKITVGEMIAAVQLMNYIINPLVQSIMTINKIKSTKDITNKMMEMMKETEVDTNLKVKSDFKNKISLENISFSYNKEKQVLDGISLDFEKGKKYALVGSSGSGKSTLLKLLLGYYKNYTGKLNIDSTEFKSIQPNSMYELICAIHQNVYLFEGTIKDNITLYKNYSKEEIHEAVKLAEIEKLLESLPNGLNTFVGENGNNLSGGEKQRVSIARAIIKRAPIILLDEATSALDIEKAVSIEKTMLSQEGITSIVVTHRLSKDILAKYDEIIVMNEGKIVEQGNFAELFVRKGILYSMLEQEESKEAS